MPLIPDKIQRILMGAEKKKEFSADEYKSALLAISQRFHFPRGKDVAPGLFGILALHSRT